MTDTPQILLAHHLKALKLPTFLREYDKVARLCAAEGVDHPRYLMRLAEMEMIDRERRMVDRRIKAARFPTVKSLDSFDFLALPSLNKMLVLELARSDYVERRENVIAVGNSGTGKSHVALGLGLAALGRPGYINLGHADDLAGGQDEASLRMQSFAVLDAAYHAGITTFDAARSYGQDEAFLAEWLESRQLGPDDVQVGSKWGYTYIADWQVQANQHKVKEHSLPNFIWQ